MNYDTHLFIEIIESVQGITFLRSDHSEGIHVRFYQGIGGNLVMIDTTDDDITNDEGKGHLRNLGLSHLIKSIFPS